MSTNIKFNKTRVLVFSLILLASLNSNAFQSVELGIAFNGGPVIHGGGGPVINGGPGPIHSHGGWGGGGNYHGGYHGGPYNRGGYYYGGGWGAPNVIIDVPIQGDYEPVCFDVEVCDNYGVCWLEQDCN